MLLLSSLNLRDMGLFGWGVVFFFWGGGGVAIPASIFGGKYSVCHGLKQKSCKHIWLQKMFS